MSRSKTKKRRVSGLTTRALVNKLDRIFSRYTRLKDADENGTVACVTCGKLAHWSEVHAGHWIKRQYQSVRFDPRNVHAQCVADNLHHGGKQDEYGKYIIDRYGLDAFNELLAKKRETKKWTREELENMIADYIEKVRTLESGLNFQA